MDEHLDLDAAAFCNGLDFLKRKFAREDDADESQLFQGEDTFEVVGHKLRRGMEREGGEVLSHKPSDAEILDNEAIGAEFVEDGELFDRCWQFRVVHERVEGDVDLLAAQHVRVGEQLA